MLYSAGFDVSDPALGLGTLTIANGINADVVITLADVRGTDANSAATALMFHHESYDFDIISQDGNSTERLRKWARQGFGSALTTAIQADASAKGWGGYTFLVTQFLHDTGLYAIGWALGGTDLTFTWSTAAGRALLGFSATQSGSDQYTGTQIPYFVLKPTQPAVSSPTPDREVGPVASLAISDSGDVAYGVAMSGAKIERDWMQQFEPIAKTSVINATEAHPFTHQHLFNHCRRGYPFAVIDGGFGDDHDIVCHLRPEGTAFEAPYATANVTSRRNISYRTYVMGGIIES